MDKRETIDECLENDIAMTIVNPQFCREHDIQVEVEQMTVSEYPHVRVYHDKTRDWKNSSCIRLDKPKYMNSEVYLPSELKKQFIELMQSPCSPCGRLMIQDKHGDFTTMTSYQYAVMVWVETFEDGKSTRFKLDEGGLPVMPDYSLLEEKE